MKKVILKSLYAPTVEVGQTENHYGVPFTVTDTAEKDEKGRKVIILTADLEDADADAMVEAGRATFAEVAPVVEPPVDPKKAGK